MKQNLSKFIPVNDDTEKGRSEHFDLNTKISSEMSPENFDFVYFELENEWLQEYELIYNSYKTEK